jgi:coenzyme F420 hydrogenase subunit beta
MKGLRTVADVAERRLCTGCGACAYVDPRIRMVDTLAEGRRPLVRVVPADERAREALAICPGRDQSNVSDAAAPGLLRELAPTWGPVLELWEGHAADPTMRFRASSGGAASALATYCIERAGMHGLLHIAAREDVPYLNETVLSRTREEIVSRSGSRYAPASPCDGLQRIEDAPAPCVFIGKPCDCLAVAKVRAVRPALDRKLGLVIGFFCAGTPTVAGTLAMLRKMGIEDPSTLRSLRYRGEGWPGRATAVLEVNGRRETRSLSYSESWGDVLADHKQWRCNLCPDRTGEAADIAVGDPWWNGVPDDAPGRSLIVARTERGRRILADAIAAGYLVAQPMETWKLRASQPGFPKVRGSIWGRLVTLRLLLVPAPRYAGYALFRHWVRELSPVEKLRSIAGTARRVLSRGLRRRVPVVPHAPRPAASRLGEALPR